MDNSKLKDKHHARAQGPNNIILILLGTGPPRPVVTGTWSTRHRGACCVSDSKSLKW